MAFGNIVVDRECFLRLMPLANECLERVRLWLIAAQEDRHLQMAVSADDKPRCAMQTSDEGWKLELVTKLAERQHFARITAMAEHELPQAITELTEDETVCKYCGVSYLVHREVKRYKAEAEAARKQLQDYKEAGERQPLLLKRITELEGELDAARALANNASVHEGEAKAMREANSRLSAQLRHNANLAQTRIKHVRQESDAAFTQIKDLLLEERRHIANLSLQVAGVFHDLRLQLANSTNRVKAVTEDRDRLRALLTESEIKMKELSHSLLDAQQLRDSLQTSMNKLTAAQEAKITETSSLQASLASAKTQLSEVIQ